MSPSQPAIGSVLPLPDVEADPPRADSLWAIWTGAHRHASAFRCGRAALAALLRARNIRRVWAPAYGCVSLAEGLAGRERLWFGVDAKLRPDLEALAAGLRAGDAVVAIDYFGRAPESDLVDLVAARPDILWIEDRAQALEPGRPAWGRAVLYSPRKLVGVADGGLLVSDEPLPEPAGPPRPDDAAAQIARRGDPDGLYPDRWFPAFQAQERAFAVDDAPMSTRTRRLLERIALPPLAAGRRANAAWLAERLADLALWPEAPQDFAPLAFPIQVADAAAVSAGMAQARIYCARHWADPPSDPERFPIAHRLSRQLLSLPCDPRYGEADMARIVERLRALQVRGAR